MPVRTIYNKKTRFGKIHVHSIYDEVRKNKKDAEKTKKKQDEDDRKDDAEKKTRPEVKLRGRTTGNLNAFSPNGFYHAASIDFALGPPRTFNNTPLPAYNDEEDETWGTGFGNPLVNPKRDCVYIVRATIEQLRGEPLIGGFKLRWYWPTGWRPVDGQPRSIYVEAASNPLYVQRLFLSPLTRAEVRATSGGAFRARIRSWYP